MATMATDDIAGLEANFARMLHRWQALAPADDGEDASTTARPQDVTAWAETMDLMRQTHARLAASGKWRSGPADLLTLLGINGLELHHSALLRWALDPLASHGLGSRLLEELWSVLWPSEQPPDELWRVSVRTEVFRSGTRADVVVFGKGWGLVVENKVGAAEQPEQGDRLAREFRRPFRHVWLSPAGVRPSTAPHSIELWHPLSYGELAEAVSAAAERAANAAPSIKDWAATLKSMS